MKTTLISITLIFLTISGCKKPVECYMDLEKNKIFITDTSLIIKSITIYLDYKSDKEEIYKYDNSNLLNINKVFLDEIFASQNISIRDAISHVWDKMYINIIIVDNNGNSIAILYCVCTMEDIKTKKIISINVKS
jgi:hypothetical protein